MQKRPREKPQVIPQSRNELECNDNIKHLLKNPSHGESFSGRDACVVQPSCPSQLCLVTEGAPCPSLFPAGRAHLLQQGLTPQIQTFHQLLHSLTEQQC